MPTGTDYLNDLTQTKSPSDWDALAQKYWAQGAVPSWISNRDAWPAVTVTGGGHTLVYRVAPDFFSVGTDQDFAIAPMTPMGAQAIANLYAAILPSRKMVRDIFAVANKTLPLSDVKASPYNIPLNQIETPAAIAAARTRDRTQYSAPPAGGIIDGHRKDIVVGPNLDGSRVAIYGGQGGNVDGHFWQPYSTIHSSSYADYSHGTRLVAMDATLDGQPANLVTIFTDPQLSTLVSDQGTFAPFFPNVGSGAPAIAQMAVNLPTTETVDMTSQFDNVPDVQPAAGILGSISNLSTPQKVIGAAALAGLAWWLFSARNKK